MCKKRIVVVSLRDKVSSGLAEQIRHTLKGIVEVEAAQPESLGEAGQIDAIVTATTESTSRIGGLVPSGTPVLTVMRTLRRDGWERVMAIPARTRVLIVNDTRETALDTASLLHNLGAVHLELVPWYPGADLPGNVALAITPGEPHLVPPAVRRILDIGDRVVDPSTLTDLLAVTDMLNAENQRLVLEYSDTVMGRPGLHRTLGWLLELKKQNQAILDTIAEGIIAYDADGRVTLVNQRAEDLLARGAWEVVGKSLNLLWVEIGLGGNRPPNDDGATVVQLAGRPLVFHHRQTASGSGGVFTVRSVSDVEELEIRLSQDRRARGHTAKYAFEDIVSVSPIMKEAVERARRMTRGDASIVIYGETGTGKELFAQAIHRASARSQFPLVAVNCASVPESLLESELFGYEEGAFTGARRGGKAGLFEQAHKGTIFLDEIGDLSLHLQGRLLRVLQEREVMRIGSDRIRPVDVRVVSATNRNLSEMVARGEFRADLYYRLNVLTLHLPALRERPEDIPPLARGILAKLGERRPLQDEVVQALMAYPWPGNVRELHNCMQYMVNVAVGPFTVNDLPQHLRAAAGWPAPAPAAPDGAARSPSLPLAPVEQQLLLLLHQHGHRGAGRSTLRAMAGAAGLTLSDRQVRRGLETLAATGLVRSQRGRGGSWLTAAGQAALQAVH